VLRSLLYLVATAGVCMLVPLLAANSAVAFVALTAAAVAAGAVGSLLLGSQRLAGRPNLAEQIIGRATDGILTISKNGLVLSLNPAGERLFGAQGRGGAEQAPH
jgi:hypothetical protein